MLLIDTLPDGYGIPHDILTTFIRDGLGAEPDDMPESDFAYLTAKGVSTIVRAMTVSPIIKGKLFAQCRWLAAELGGEVAYTFTLSGLHDEPIQAPAPPP